MFKGVHSETHRGEKISVKRGTGRAAGTLEVSINGQVLATPYGRTNADAVRQLDATRGTVDDAYARPANYTNGYGETSFGMKLPTPEPEPVAAPEPEFEDDDYKMSHRAPGPEDGGRADDLNQWFPDIYTRPSLYSNFGPEVDKETVKSILAMKDSPDAEVTVYRAVPPGVTAINPGDWVSTSRAYATQHGVQDEDEANDWPVIEQRVRARDLYTEGNEINEWGYSPDESRSPQTAEQLRDSLQQKYGVDLSLQTDSRGRLIVPRIIVPKESRNTGVGSKVMEEIVAYADANSLEMGLTPSSDFGGNKSRLEQFYRRYGFVPNKGRNKDFTTRETMIRPARVG